MNETNVNTTQILTFKCDFHMERRRHGQLELRTGRAPQKPPVPQGRVPRVARLMALAIHFEALIQRGEVADYADVARLGHVTRARVTQVMNLLLLAPDVQEAILFLPDTVNGSDAIREQHVRPIAAERRWAHQRRLWKALSASRRSVATP